MSEFRKAKTRVQISPGESVRIMRELQELSQNQLAEAVGMSVLNPSHNISIEVMNHA